MKTATIPLSALVAEIVSGVSPVCEERDAGADEIGVLRLSAVTAGRLDLDDAKALAVGIDSTSWPRVKAGTILIARASGSKSLVGACVLSPQDCATRVIPDTVWQMSLGAESGVSARWLLEFLRSSAGRRAIMEIARGTSGIWKITKGSFGRLEVPLPRAHVISKADQFGEAADSVDDKLNALLRAKRSLKRGLIQQMLSGHRRFPRFARTGPYCPISLGEFFHEKNERNRDNRATRVFSCSKVYGIIPQDERFSKRLASRNTRNYKVVSPGDLVYDPMLLWDASIGFVGGDEAGVVSPAYATFEYTGSEEQRSFVRHSLQTHRARHLFRAISRGTNVRRKKALPDDFLKIQITVPPTREEQSEVGRLLDTVDSEIALLTKMQEVLRARKRALMQRLLSGELTVPAPAHV